MNEHQFTDKQSHVYTHNKLESHEIDFNNVEILDSADNDNKLCWKEMLYIRQHKPTHDELFTLIIRNVQLESSITKDIKKYFKTTKKQHWLNKFLLSTKEFSKFLSSMFIFSHLCIYSSILSPSLF